MTKTRKKVKWIVFYKKGFIIFEVELANLFDFDIAGKGSVKEKVKPFNDFLVYMNCTRIAINLEVNNPIKNIVINLLPFQKLPEPGIVEKINFEVFEDPVKIDKPSRDYWKTILKRVFIGFERVVDIIFRIVVKLKII